MAVAVVFLQISSCLGFGALVLKVFGLHNKFKASEHAIISFAIGFGIIGWLVFPLGVAKYLAPELLLALLLIGIPGIALLRWQRPILVCPNALSWFLILIISVVAAIDLVEALAPPADADTLAYHFTVPRTFIESGGIEFILRPIDGSVPYLIQLTYIPILALGGEISLTFWTMITGWASGALLYVLCRQHLNQSWSLTVVAIFLTTPVVVYAAGTGQIEIRAAMFVLLAAFFIARSLETGELNYTILAGIAAGFYGGSKYIGLLFALAAGIVLVMQRRWLVQGSLFSIAAIIAGSQWYIWNAIHTGDPFFPVLFQWLGNDDLLLWTKAHDLLFKENYFPIENPAPRSIWWYFSYPFSATLNSFPVFESKKAGFGPYAWIILPFILIGFWTLRNDVCRNRIQIYASIIILFYSFWFFSGSSQRIRLISPILPLFLICVTVAAQRGTAQSAIRKSLIFGIGTTLVLHLTGSALFSKKYFRYLLQPETRHTFLMNNVSAYGYVPWVNKNLSTSDKLLTNIRQHLYYIKIPTLYASPNTQDAFNLYNPTKSVVKAHLQLSNLGVTHVLTRPIIRNGKIGYSAPLNLLFTHDCLEVVKSFNVKSIRSRTINSLRSDNNIPLDILRLRPSSCSLV